MEPMKKRIRREPKNQRPNCFTKADYQKHYADVIADYTRDPTQSTRALQRKFGISDQTINNVLNRSGAIYETLSEPKRKEMGREMRLSFFRAQKLEQDLADARRLTARDLRDIAVARGITAQHINLIEGMPTAIEVNVDVYREKFAQIAQRMIQGARLAGVLPEGTRGDDEPGTVDAVVEDRTLSEPSAPNHRAPL